MLIDVARQVVFVHREYTGEGTIGDVLVLSVAVDGTFREDVVVMVVYHLVEHPVENLVGEQMAHEADAHAEEVVVALCRLLECKRNLLLDLVLVSLLTRTRNGHCNQQNGEQKEEAHEHALQARTTLWFFLLDGCSGLNRCGCRLLHVFGQWGRSGCVLRVEKEGAQLVHLPRGCPVGHAFCPDECLAGDAFVLQLIDAERSRLLVVFNDKILHVVLGWVVIVIA